MLALLSLEQRADVRMLALSGGETRRVDLACTLMGSPELVILDEPTTGLDPESRREVWRLVSDLRDGGATVLLTTHYLEEAETLADRLEIMHAGRIVRSGHADRDRGGATRRRSASPASTSCPAASPASAASSTSTGGRSWRPTRSRTRSPSCMLWAAQQRGRSSTRSTPAARASRASSSSIADGRDPDAVDAVPDRAREPPMSTATVADRFSIGRTARLTRWNAVLLTRNRLAFVYAVLLPLLPLLLLFTGDRGDRVRRRVRRSSPCSSSSALFPVYYNVLSQFVSRRDELVLKRMRTGEARDAELLVSIALPGALERARASSAIAVPIAAALRPAATGQPDASTRRWRCWRSSCSPRSPTGPPRGPGAPRPRS